MSLRLDGLGSNLKVLEAMSENEAAQRLRLQTFRDQLDPEMLRAYVGKLPDFEDDEALDEAFAHYEVLAPAAEALEEGHAVAATILYRALIDDVLSRGRSQAYGHAARHLAQLDLMAAEIAGSTLEPHEAYRAALRKAYGRKHGFWNRFGSS